MDWTIYITFTIAMLAISNPIGNLAIFVSLTSDKNLQEKRATAKKAGLAIGLILVIVVWTGTYILDFFGISPSAFESAGALIIILLGLSMINGNSSSGSGHSNMHHTKEEHESAKKQDSVAIVPLSIPIAAGPGAITTIIVHAHQWNFILDKVIVSAICIALAIIQFVCFYFGNYIQKVVGDNGVKIATRILGLILMAIAFTMLGQGLVGLFPGLGGDQSPVAVI